MLDLSRIDVLAEHPLENQSRLLCPEALAFVAYVVRSFRPRIEWLLAQRSHLRKAFDAGEAPDFRHDTSAIRALDWKCQEAPTRLKRRHVALTGSAADTRTLVDGVGSGADCFVADLEDATSPSWSNVMRAHANLRDVCWRPVDRRPRDGAAGTTATLLVKPRGLHLPEGHVAVDGRRVPATLFDIALFWFHSARVLATHGEGPFFCLPKIQSFEEALFYEQLFACLERAFRIDVGTVKAMVLVETLPAVFQLDEILWALRARSAGLGLGRSALVFDFIKTRAVVPAAMLPDRSRVTSERAFLAAASKLLVQTAHRRGVHAIGSVATQLPIRRDRARSIASLVKLRNEKALEAHFGFDGTAVMHPTLVPIVRQVFESKLDADHQFHVTHAHAVIQRSDLLAVPEGPRTEDGVRRNVRLVLTYLDEWFRGHGAVMIDHRIADAAVAESARVQLWKWVRHRARLDDGAPLTKVRFRRICRCEADRVGASRSSRSLLENMSLARRVPEFMTIPAYALLTARRKGARRAAQKPGLSTR